MKKNLLAIILILFIVEPTFSQIENNANINNITIARDNYGVPHIFTKTDAEAAYALAWVQAEDNFYEVQESLLAVRGLLSAVTGKKGVLLDAAMFLIDVDSVVDEKYEAGLSPHFKQILEAYVQGFNVYAKENPKEVRHKKLFPLSAKDVVKGYVLNMTFMAHLQYDLGRIIENELGAIEMDNTPRGSNGIVISPKLSADNKTYLLSNSHQPLEGFATWYEVQINTEEGWQFHGATFASGVTPFVGTNKNLGWTHCLNYDDFVDVFKLKIHPKKKNFYALDGEWLALEKRKLKLKVKIAGIRIPVSRNFYWSKYGPVLKNKSGYYAIRFPANMVIGSIEQWYRMNKAKNFNEFKAAINMHQFPSINTIYSDKEGNIMYLSNGLFPNRNPNYNWKKIVPGDTTATLWKPKFKPVEDLISVTNPECGYVFNMNNTGYDCTCAAENPNPNDYDKTMGLQTGRTARSIRFHALIDTFEKISYKDFKSIKYDSNLEFPLYTRGIENLDLIRNLDERKYPEIEPAIKVIKKWNGSTDIDNKQAAVYSLAVQHLLKYLNEHHLIELNNTIPETEFVKALHFAQKHLNKYYGSLEIPLGDLQKHIRGDKEYPIWGVPEVITQMYTKPYKKGTYKSYLGESFILFATYGKDGVEKIETINCYGTSNKKDSPYYTDQMELFVNKQLKPITMNKKEILEKAVRIYNPK